MGVTRRPGFYLKHWESQRRQRLGIELLGGGGSTAVGNHHAVEVTEELGHLNNDRLCSRALR